MWLFWAAAAILAAAAGALIVLRAARAGKGVAEGADPSLEVYRRHLGELDGLAERGLLEEEELRAARAEASRRLLSAAHRKSAGEAPGGRGARFAAIGVAAGAAVLAAGIYVIVGAPGYPDQPYKARVAAWRAGDIRALGPQEVAAVLESLAAERPNDPQLMGYLGRAQLEAGEPFAAQRALEKAIALDPQRGELQSALALALLNQSDGKLTPQAEAAFSRAIALDPNDVAARYYLGQGKMDRGDRAGGIADWKALVAVLPEGDPRRPALLAEISRAEGGPDPAKVAEAAAVAQAAGTDQAAFIRGMVQSLAERLKREPKDAAGWARLVRSYGVLGDTAAQQSALAEARRIFAADPASLKSIEAEAAAPPARQ